MAKGDRSRANKSKRDNATAKISRDDALPLQQNEAYLIQGFVDQSNIYGKLLKQFEQYEFALQNMTWKRKQIQKGEITVNKDNPVLIPLVGNSMCQVTDKKQILKDLDEQIKSIQLSRDGIKSQMIHRRDEYVESALRLHNFLKDRYGKYTTKTLDNKTGMGTGVRVKSGQDKVVKEQEKIFEAEMADILKDAETAVKYKEAVKKANKHNKELKEKKE